MIYCRECKYYYSWGYDVKSGKTIYLDRCEVEQNIGYKETYRERERVYKKIPLELNKENDCICFEEKEEKIKKKKFGYSFFPR